MSLVGSLEDLGLGEILQIISLSRKSGTLRLRSGEGEGHIVFRDGEIRRAALKGEPTDLAELLTRKQVLPSEEVDRLLAHARSEAEPFEDLLLRHGVVSVERLDGLRLEHVEGAVLRMFRWITGDFSFEVHAGPGPEPHPGGLTLSGGLNPQFLALEGTRLQDEAGRVDAEEGLELPFHEPELEAERRQEPARWLPRPPTAIVIEPDLECLETAKSLLSERFLRVHAFQRPDLGIERIRQYLGRGSVPLVLLSDRTPADSLTGARDWRQILGRLKALAPQMPVLLMAEGGARPRLDPALDGVVQRPDAKNPRGLLASLDELLEPPESTGSKGV
ncbi:MAG: DUF4388 domain-containing protein [Myxococcota bacterium]